jgi:sugar/nucleoside kinase (ribokinase family)
VHGEPDDAGDAGALDVVAIGSALVDVLTQANEEDLRGLGMVKGSMTLVDLPRADAVYDAMGPAIEVSGGSAANTAAGVAALGGRVGYVGKVAADELGEVFLHDIAAAGVTLGRIDPVPADGSATGGSATGGSATGGSAAGGRATGRCLVLVTDDGERTMATHLGVASTLGPEDLDEELVSRAQVVYLEGYLWDLGPAKEALRRAMDVAHGNDALVALTLSDPFCVERHQREFLDLLHGVVVVLFANDEEATLLFGAGTFDGAVEAVEETGLLAALTRGAAGSVVVSASGPVSIPATEVARVIDTTGAGDLYAAGFLYGLTHGQDPVGCARLGGLCAAEIISHVGARPHADLRQLARDAGLL